MRKFTNILLIVVVTGFILSAVGCGKEWMDTRYEIKAMTQMSKTNQNNLVPCSKFTKAYIFYVSDTVGWRPISYEEALMGIIRKGVEGADESVETKNGSGDGNNEGENGNIDESAVKKFDLEADPNPMPNLMFGSVKAERFVIVAVNTQEEVYAWRGATIVPNLHRVQISLVFNSTIWNTEKTYKKNGWQVVDKNVPKKEPEPEPEPDPKPDPQPEGEA